LTATEGEPLTEHGPGVLRRAADLIDSLAAACPEGRWRLGGLLASRPEVIAYRDGGTEHVAEARSRSARWIVALQPAVAPHLAGWLRAEADRCAALAAEPGEHPTRLAHLVLSGAGTATADPAAPSGPQAQVSPAGPRGDAGEATR
jgi:hypothetical protein